MRRAAVVLVGGGSERMGADKASLEWQGAPLVVHVVQAVRAGLEQPAGDRSRGVTIVVRAPGQVLPALPSGVEVVDDAVPGRGPLQGLRDGLAAVSERADVAFVASTDLPLLRPEVVRLVVDAVGDDVDAAVPVVQGRRHPLAAAYRTSLVPLVDELLAAGERRVGALADRCRALWLDEEELGRVDPELRSLVNVNTPADLDALG